jgi:hypothetical protein
MPAILAYPAENGLTNIALKFTVNPTRPQKVFLSRTTNGLADTARKAAA